MRGRRVGASMRSAISVVSVLAVFAVLSLLAPVALGAPLSLRPAAPAPAVVLNINSTIGSGYETGVGGNGTLTAVSSSWIQPRVSCTALNATALIEAGIGSTGIHSQIGGTAVSCHGGVASAFAWYSFVSSGVTKIPVATVPVHAGLIVKVTVTQHLGHVTIVVKVASHNFTKTANVSGADKYTAVGVARMLVSGVPQPLANFGNVSFGKMYTRVGGTTNVTVNGTSSAIGTFPMLAKFTMVDSLAKKLAAPGAITAAGSSFVDRWYAST
jgi:hypothetical protein